MSFEMLASSRSPIDTIMGSSTPRLAVLEDTRAFFMEIMNGTLVPEYGLTLELTQRTWHQPAVEGGAHSLSLHAGQNTGYLVRFIGSGKAQVFAAPGSCSMTKIGATGNGAWLYLPPGTASYYTVEHDGKLAAQGYEVRVLRGPNPRSNS